MYLMSRAGVAPKLQLTSQRSNADCAKQPPLSVRGVSVTECERREQIYLLDEDGDVGRECHERLDAGEAAPSLGVFAASGARNVGETTDGLHGVRVRRARCVRMWRHDLLRVEREGDSGGWPAHTRTEPNMRGCRSPLAVALTLQITKGRVGTPRGLTGTAPWKIPEKTASLKRRSGAPLCQMACERCERWPSYRNQQRVWYTNAVAVLSRTDGISWPITPVWRRTRSIPRAESIAASPPAEQPLTSTSVADDSPSSIACPSVWSTIALPFV